MNVCVRGSHYFLHLLFCGLCFYGVTRDFRRLQEEQEAACVQLGGDLPFPYRILAVQHNNSWARYWTQQKWIKYLHNQIYLLYFICPWSCSKLPSQNAFTRLCAITDVENHFIYSYILYLLLYCYFMMLFYYHSDDICCLLTFTVNKTQHITWCDKQRGIT